MKKDGILFGIIGLLAGLILGFYFANSINRNAISSVPTAGNPGMTTNSNMPPGHPDISGAGATAMGTDGTGAAGGMGPMQAVIDKAKAEPNNFDAQFSAAESYYQIQRFDQAIEFLLKANKLKPDDYETIVNLGNSYFDSEKYEEAEKWYANALTKKPENNNVRTDLGLTYMFRAKPDYDKAIQEFTAVTAKEPTHPQALQNLTVAYARKGDSAKATETLAQLESIDPTNPAIANLRGEIQKMGTK